MSAPAATTPAGPTRADRIVFGLGFAAWVGFAAWCAHGFPPSVDLAAHGAELEVLKRLLQGDPTVQAVYTWHFTIGYGLPTWLFLPVAWLFDGATAARAALFGALALFPPAVAAVLRAGGRPLWPALLAAPFAFNLSYWYGLLPGLWAQPLALFAFAAMLRFLDAPSGRRAAAVNVLAGAVLLCHLFTFGVLAVATIALAIARRGWRGAPRPLAAALALSAALGLPMLVRLLARSVDDGPYPQTRWDGAAHLNWFFKHFTVEGHLAVWAPLLIFGVCLAVLLRAGARQAAPPVAVGALYVITPKTLGGIFLACTRIPPLVGLLALGTADLRRLPRPAVAGLFVLALLSLGETARFHLRFRDATAGLEELTATPGAPRHGYLSLEGFRVLGSRHIYLAHLGQWWTARHGGIGHDFFADAAHHAVQFRPGRHVQGALDPAALGSLDDFDALLVFGDGPLPSALQAWRVEARAGRWRRLARN